MSGLGFRENCLSVLTLQKRRLNVERRHHTDVQNESVQRDREGGGINATRTQPIHRRNYRREHGRPLGGATGAETFFILCAYR